MNEFVASCSKGFLGMLSIGMLFVISRDRRCVGFGNIESFSFRRI